MSTEKTTDEPNRMLDLDDVAPDRLPVNLPGGAGVTEMVSPKELSVMDRARLVNLTNSMMTLQEKVTKAGEKKTEPTKADQRNAAELDRVMREVTRRVLPDAPADVIDGMQTYHLDLVTGNFLVRYGDMMKKVAAAMGASLPRGVPTTES